VSDSGGEAFYLRDEESGQFWSPLPWPCRGANAYVTRHGFGYSIFEHTEAGLYSETQIYVALDAAVKIVSLKVRNVSGRARRLSATGYIEWVLGDFRFKSGPQVVTEIDLGTGAILAGNSNNSDFPGRTGFFDVEGSGRSVTCDRLEFLGPNGRLAAPAAMLRTRLSGRAGAALDQCAAAQTIFELADGEEREVVFKLGVGRDRNEALDLIHRFRNPDSAREALDKVWQHWNHTLGAVNVETPDQSFNLMANGWLLYQTLACRLWARGATYQSGGAFGFRDQLQDVAAFIHARPSLTREHLLLCAAHQFTEGDVQHWWHPPLNRGVRTRCSDDYLWLPLVLCRYVEATSDAGILDEPVKFLEGRRLKADENSCYDLPGEGEEANLYEHCLRAVRHGLKFGAHGLPLIGSGDWNDGFDRVGEGGSGESVWLGFFLYEVLTKFASLAQLRQDQFFYDECLAEAAKLRLNLAAHGWDGGWYRRAYFDDGSALGSAVNSECRIDSIAQSWSVLSGAGERERTVQAMEALDQYLIDRDQALVKLLAPPFDVSEPNPGYIKGYLPGVRENGGQYTHAAVWAGMAFAVLGSGRRAWEIFNLINPVNHTATPEGLQVYKVEPYVMAADVYAAPPHAGRGGWTWYTGSAAWMYRFMMESLLGITLKNGQLSLKPLFPAHWKEFKVHYRFRETVYHLTVRPADSAAPTTKITLDGLELENPLITLIDDHLEHWATVEAPHSG
jgi:cellobiose phosphorylase